MDESEELVVFVDQYNTAFSWVPCGDHCEVVGLRSEAFRNWYVRRSMARGERVTLSSVREELLRLQATAGLRRHDLANRSVCDPEGGLWIDLADQLCRSVHVTAGGWRVGPTPRPMFRRFTHQRPLPDPDPDGDLRYLLDYLPAMTEADEILVLVWTVLALLPVPRPVLMFTGPQGSAKTTASRFVRRLTDPSKVEVLGRDARADLPLTFHKHAVPVFDNVDTLSPQEADLLCQAVTGRGVARRKLYTDDDEYILTFQRAVILNGLHLPTSRPDMLDRMLIVPLDRVSTDGRQTLSAVEDRFAAALPGLFGGLLNVLARTLALIPEVDSGGLTRMADFHRAGRAAAEALGVPSDLFDLALQAAVARQQVGAMENPLALALLLFAREVRRWRGEPQELFERLAETAKARQIRRTPEHWPDTAAGLGRRLKSLREVLTRHGVRIDRPRRGERREVVVEYDPAADVAAED